jgi:hypothetical protein
MDGIPWFGMSNALRSLTGVWRFFRFGLLAPLASLALLSGFGLRSLRLRGGTAASTGRSDDDRHEPGRGVVRPRRGPDGAGAAEKIGDEAFLLVAWAYMLYRRPNELMTILT